MNCIKIKVLHGKLWDLCFAPGNPRRGFPTPKQSTGLFWLRLSKKSGESLVLQSESPPCEGGWRGVSLVGRVFRRLLLSACGGVLNPSVCCADSSPRRGAKLPATSPYRIHDRAEKIESSDTAPIRAAPACLQKSLFRQAGKPLKRLDRNF